MITSKRVKLQFNNCFGVPKHMEVLPDLKISHIYERLNGRMGGRVIAKPLNIKQMKLDNMRANALSSNITLPYGV